MGTMLALLGGLGTPELIAILVVVFLLFGAKKLPELARGLGKSLGEFKKAKGEFEDELLNSEQHAKHTEEKKQATIAPPAASEPVSPEAPKAEEPYKSPYTNDQK